MLTRLFIRLLIHITPFAFVVTVLARMDEQLAFEQRARQITRAELMRIREE